jgi:hypothetical protein
MARPRGTGKPPEEKYIARSIRFPRELWAELEARSTGERGRSALVREAVERLLRERGGPVTAPAGTREERVRQAYGSMAHVGPTVDEFLRGKREEVELEEAAHRRRWGNSE